jgi:hypothetical protein
LIESHIRELSARRAVKLTLHAQQEMLEEEISVADLLSCLEGCTVIENYPDHRRGACCLACGTTAGGRPLHVVCTTERPELIIITVYEPKPPKWETPFARGKRT